VIEGCLLVSYLGIGLDGHEFITTTLNSGTVGAVFGPFDAVLDASYTVQPHAIVSYSLVESRYATRKRLADF
jgi:hypothetical protein